MCDFSRGSSFDHVGMEKLSLVKVGGGKTYHPYEKDGLRLKDGKPPLERHR